MRTFEWIWSINIGRREPLYSAPVESQKWATTSNINNCLPPKPMDKFMRKAKELSLDNALGLSATFEWLIWNAHLVNFFIMKCKSFTDLQKIPEFSNLKDKTVLINTINVLALFDQEMREAEKISIIRKILVALEWYKVSKAELGQKFSKLLKSDSVSRNIRMLVREFIKWLWD